jgi:(E)-4-hydroxy-3-methylbut-2-enyl-diphosphate synthase
MRIGVNHGSLAERLTVMHGDTPEGMVESALEYIASAKSTVIEISCFRSKPRAYP